MELYDVVVLGGGPAGYLAGERAGENGLKAAVVEKRALGGVCLNEGCVPTKTLLNSAKIYEHAKNGEPFGVKAEKISLDHGAVLARKQKVVKTLVSGVGMKLKKNGVAVYEGDGFIEKRDEEGIVVAIGDVKIKGKNLIIATGSSASVPPIEGVKDALANGFVMTNREILDMAEVPEKLVIIGGGVIGLEMACYFNEAGSSVTVIEMLDKIAGPTDAKISKILQKNMEKAGVVFKLSAKVTAVKNGAVEYEINGEKLSAAADRVLLSVGRRPNSAGIGLENIGVLAERGRVKVDEHMRTNVAGVYAAGDITGEYMLAHAAYREAEVAVNHIIGKRDRMRYSAVPSVIYTMPEAAGVGETEESARQKGLDVQIAEVSMRYSGRYLAETEGGDGICRLIVDNKYKRLVGVQMIGSYASEMIYGAALMIETELKTDDIKELIFPHPTVCEVIREALFEIK